MSWTEERIDLLQKLWLQGMSASRIAEELAHGLTRNAVIGKVYRLGLSGRVKAPSMPTSSHPRPSQQQQHQPRPPRAPSPRQSTGAAPTPTPIMVQGNNAMALQPATREAVAPEQNLDVVVAMAEPVTILDLRESMCRWPIGDPTAPEFRFCGAKKLPGVGPYCACHASIAFQPQHERRRERKMQSTG
jgi:GcrA cell cycle regulator